jgi:WD40 repeat protein
MVLGMAIGLIVVGLFALITGKLKLSKDRTLTGAGVRVAGVIFLLPFPIQFCIGFIVGFATASQGKPFDPKEWELTFSLVLLALCIVCALLGCGIAWGTSRSSAPPSVDEEPDTVLPVEPTAQAISRERLPAPPLARRPPSAARPISVKRTQLAQSSGSNAVWWILGGLAIGFFVCVIPVGALIWWRLDYYTPAPKQGVVVKKDNQPIDGNNFQFKDKDWGQDAPKLPRGNEMPPGGPQQLPFQDPQQIAKPAEQPKPKPPPEGLKAVLDLGSTPTALTLSPDGKTLAVATTDMAVTLWDANTAQQRKRMEGNEKELLSLVFSPDGKWLATADNGPFVKLRDAATGKQQASIDFGDNNARVTGVAFSPDSKTLLLLAGPVKLHDLETGKQRDFFGNNPQLRQTNFFFGQFTADGKKLYLCGFRDVLMRNAAVWDVATGKLDEDLKMFPDRQFGAALPTPDEQHFIFAAPNDTVIRVWDRTARRELTPLEAKSVPTGIAFSPDGQLLVTGDSGGMVHLWDFKNGKRLAQFEANREDEHLPPPKGNPGFGGPLMTNRAVRGLAFSTDGKRLVTGQSNGFKIWDAEKAFGRPFDPAPPVAAKPPDAGKPAPRAIAEGIKELPALQAHTKDITGLALGTKGEIMAVVAGPTAQALVAPEAGEIKLCVVRGRKEIAHAAGDAIGGFTPDGKQLLCMLHPNALDLVGITADGGGEVFGFGFVLRDGRTLELRPGQVRCAGGIISPDGKYLLTKHILATGAALKLHELTTLKESQTWRELKGGNIGALAFAPDSRSFAASITGKPDVVICNATDGKPQVTCTGHTSEVQALAFSPDGKRLATGGLDKTIKLWDPVTGKPVATLEGHTGGITFLAYAHDGRLLVSLSGDNTIRLWDTAGEKEPASLELPAGTAQPVMAFEPSGKVLAAARGKEVRLWDVSALVGPSVAIPAGSLPKRNPAAGEPRPAEPPLKKRVEVPGSKPPVVVPSKPRVDVPPPKKTDPPVRPTRAPDKAGIRQTLSLPISKNSFVNALVFSPDGRELISAGDDGRVRRWSVETGNELESSFDAHPRVSMLSIAVSADGKLLATSSIDKTAKIWSAADNKLLTTIDGSERLPLVHAALSPDGKILATGSNQVRLWDASTGKEIGSVKSRPNFIEALVFSADGKRLACSGVGNTVKVWDTAERKETATLSGHTRPVMGLAFSADGTTLASASADKTIKLWNLETNKERLTLTGHADPLSSVAFSPDGRLLVTGAGAIRFDPGRLGEVKLWDAATGQFLADLKGHNDGVSCVAFSSDGKTVASAGRDRMVRVWDVSAFAGRKTTPAK